MTQEGATTEAERLARQNPQVRFYVLESVCLRMVDAMQRIEMRPAEEPELPF